MNRIRSAAGHLRRAARCIGRAARAIVRGPEEPINGPSTADWHQPEGAAHPSLLCKCGNVGPGEHLPGREWAAVMCRTCEGMGHCPECHGDGIGREDEPAAAPEPAADDLAELERLARSATPGPWRWGDWSATFGTLESVERMDSLERNLTHPGPEPYVRQHGDGCYRVLRCADREDSPADAAYLAAASPDRVLALIAGRRAAEAERDAARAESASREAELAELRARVQDLEGRLGVSLLAPRTAPPHVERRVGRYTHLVVITREGAPEVRLFESYADAAQWHDEAGTQWTESYLTEVIKGPLT